ncbi:GIY-YIG nuclease family protein [Nisaea sediminum]|uniref:GIY-YIG nuclease family protein n=1 Tax=Nisaea sediminum TaxID=2775867 RepID=UPI001868732E|nr:GIY-YIG nuclease family protein [Nisaea sediminum]
MHSPSQGRSLELFFIDGKPDGMLTAEVFNWTGHVLVAPRTQIADALKRAEAGYTGVYLLLGEHEGGPLAYIGEGESISKRIKDHDLGKDWWTKAVMITSAANNLHKAHVQYLEARLIEEAKSVGRVQLENANNPARPSLSEADQANMEAFLEYILMVLPALRIDAFLEKKRPNTSLERPTFPGAGPPTFTLFLKKENIKATAILIEGEFVVQAGSMARKSWVGTKADKTHYWRLYDELVTQGVLIDKGTHRVFSENYAFASTSAAGAIVNGRSTAGPSAWRLQGSDKSYKDWEADKLREDLDDA